MKRVFFFLLSICGDYNKAFFFEGSMVLVCYYFYYYFNFNNKEYRVTVFVDYTHLVVLIHACTQKAITKK